MQSRLRDLTGQKFNKWTAISLWGRRENQTFWNCRCDCGTEKQISMGSLTSNNSKSCGCHKMEVLKTLHFKHGKCRKKGRDKVYNSWRAMMGRCYDPNNNMYYKYGKVGIRVFEEWHDATNFVTYMGDPPSAGHSVDRWPNKKGNYQPGNVRWATRKQQNRNKDSNVFYEMDGMTFCLSEWAERYSANYKTVHGRVKTGWDLRRALTVPTRKS